MKASATQSSTTYCDANPKSRSPGLKYIMPDATQQQLEGRKPQIPIAGTEINRVKLVTAINKKTQTPNPDRRD